jgi:hypothetical protein
VFAGNVRGDAETRLARPPDQGLLDRVVVEGAGGAVLHAQFAGVGLQPAGLGHGLLVRGAAELGEQPAVALGVELHGVEQVRLLAQLAHELDVEALQRVRLELAPFGHVVGGGVDVFVAEDDKYLVCGMGDELQFRARVKNAGALGPRGAPARR